MANDIDSDKIMSGIKIIEIKCAFSFRRKDVADLVTVRARVKITGSCCSSVWMLMYRVVGFL